MNKAETGRDFGKKLTKPRLWIVRDADDKIWGVFPSSTIAWDWAKKKWPDDDSWDVELVWPPISGSLK